MIAKIRPPTFVTRAPGPNGCSAVAPGNARQWARSAAASMPTFPVVGSATSPYATPVIAVGDRLMFACVHPHARGLRILSVFRSAEATQDEIDGVLRPHGRSCGFANEPEQVAGEHLGREDVRAVPLPLEHDDARIG